MKNNNDRLESEAYLEIPRFRVELREKFSLIEITKSRSRVEIGSVGVITIALEFLNFSLSANTELVL